MERRRVRLLVDRPVRALIKLGILNEDFGYHLIRGSMVIIFFFFGYQKWFEYEVERLIPYISNGPLIFWLYPLLGMRGATWFLGVSEWTFGTLLFLGFWNRKLGILGALGSSATFIATVTIIPFMPDGWDAAAGGFPAMTGNIPFLMKDVVLLATSLYLLTQDLRRELLSTGKGEGAQSQRHPPSANIADKRRQPGRSPQVWGRGLAGRRDTCLGAIPVGNKSYLRAVRTRLYWRHHLRLCRAFGEGHRRGDQADGLFASRSAMRRRARIRSLVPKPSVNLA